MTKKQILRGIAFLLVACLMMVGLCDLFELENTANYMKRLATFRQLEKNTVDAVIIGTSGTDRYWMGPKAYEEYGMTVYPYSSDAMPAWMYKHVVEEIYSYQNPQLIILDVRSFTQNNIKPSLMEVRARRVLDSMPLLSINRQKAAITAMKHIQSVAKEEKDWDWKVSFFLTFFKYHTKWDDEDFAFEENLGNVEHKYMGFFMNPGSTVRRSKQTPVIYDPDNYEDLDPLAESALYDFLEYAKENDLNILFLDTPKFKAEKEMGRSNTVKKIVKDHDVAYMDFYTTNKDGSFTIDFDFEKDFYNSGHTNYYGAEKFTNYFAAYLQENYTFEDHRDNERVKKDWDGVYQKIKDAVKDLEDGKTLDEVTEEAEDG